MTLKSKCLCTYHQHLRFITYYLIHILQMCLFVMMFVYNLISIFRSLQKDYLSLPMLKEQLRCVSGAILPLICLFILQLLFGFYDPYHRQNNPGWPLNNFLALIRARWNMEKVHFLCYRGKHGFADLGLSLVGKALISVPQGISAEIG